MRKIDRVIQVYVATNVSIYSYTANQLVHASTKIMQKGDENAGCDDEGGGNLEQFNQTELFNKDEINDLNVLMRELESVSVASSEDIQDIQDMINAEENDKATDNGNDTHQISPEKGPTRITVDTSASTEVASETLALPPLLVEQGNDGDENNDDNNDGPVDLTMLETMLELSNRALAVHAEIIAARDSMSAVQGAVCFAPSSTREIEDVQMVQDVATNLPFLFTHQEAQGYLSCNLPRRYAVIAMARNLHPVCESINRECSAAAAAAAFNDVK